MKNSDFSQVDQQFSEWAEEAGFHIFYEYKGEPVRSVEIPLGSAGKWQLWLEPNPSENRCTIKYWDYSARAKQSTVKVAELQAKLRMIHSEILNA